MCAVDDFPYGVGAGRARLDHRRGQRQLRRDHSRSKDHDVGLSSTISGDDGYYTLPYLQPGFYNVSAEQNGFSTMAVNGVHITVDLHTTVNLTMKIGDVSQTVTVEANAIQLETDNSELGGTVHRQQIIELPQLGRNPYNLIALQPGVLPVYNNAGIQAQINGGMANTSNVLLDGATQVNSSSGDLRLHHRSSR